MTNPRPTIPLVPDLIGVRLLRPADAVRPLVRLFGGWGIGSGIC